MLMYFLIANIFVEHTVPGLSLSIKLNLVWKSRSHLLAPPAPEVPEVALLGPVAHPIPQPVPEPYPGRAPGYSGLSGLGPQVLALCHKLLLRWYFEGFWNWFSIKMLYQIFSICHNKNIEWQKILLNSTCT